MRISLLIFVTSVTLCYGVSEEETRAEEYMKNLNVELARRYNVDTTLSWNYSINITAENEEKSNNESNKLAEYNREQSEYIKQNFNWTFYESADLRRQFKYSAYLGYYALPTDEHEEFLKILAEMLTNYATVKVCDYHNRTKCDLTLDADLDDIYSTSRDPEELAYYWKEFYDKAGTPVRKLYEEYVVYSNKAANLNNFTSAAEMWLDAYEDNTFEDQVEGLFERLRPLYQQLHGYVRYRLNQFYGDEIVSKTGPIPMHLTGSIWGQEWQFIADLVAPFPNKSTVDVSGEMRKQNITVRKMAEMADDFFTSMGLLKLPEAFWNYSVLENPNDGRELDCHPSAWDFYTGDDVRLKMCAEVSQTDFTTIHHELGHCQYYLQYQDIPLVYRDGANPGFQEAVGDVLALSVSTPKHLQAIGLLKDYVHDEEARINQLFVTALEKIVLLPFAYTLDKYRWSIFRGEVDKKDWNCAFWKLREQYSGIEPPIVRTENDFDPPAKYHVSADYEYLRYLVGYILEFDFYKSACISAGQYNATDPDLPLDNCDIYGSKEAGDALHKMLSMGSSKPWPDALEAYNGERTMTADAIAEYFEPLRVWLEAENEKNNVPIGWTSSDKCVSAQKRNCPARNRNYG